MTTTGPTSKKLDKATAGYREGDADLNCATCTHFREPVYSCRIVEGTIDPRFWCTKRAEKD